MSRCNVSVVDVLVTGRAILSSLPILGAFDVADVHDVANWLGGCGLGPCAVDIINDHLVADELIGLRFYVFEGLKRVVGVERI